MDTVFARLPEFVTQHPWLCLLLVAIVIGLIVTELLHFSRGFKELNPAALTLIINRENALLVDLSSQQDFDKGHIPGARHVPLAQFDPESKDLAKIKDRPVVVVCKSGATSAKAAKRLLAAKFTAVYTLAGGNDAWRRADLPMASGKS